MHISLLILPIILLSFAGSYLLELLVINEYTPINAELLYSKTKGSNQKSNKLGLTGSLKTRFLQIVKLLGIQNNESKEKFDKIINIYEESQYLDKFPLTNMKGKVTTLSRSLLLKRKSSISLGLININNNDLYNLIKTNPKKTAVALYYYYDRELFGMNNIEGITPLKEWMLCFEDRLDGKILGASLDTKKQNLTIAYVKQNKDRKYQYFIKVYNGLAGFIDVIEKSMKTTAEEVLKGNNRRKIIDICLARKHLLKRIDKQQYTCFKEEAPLNYLDFKYYQMRNQAINIKKNSLEIELKPKSLITSLDRYGDLIVYSVLNDNLIFRSYLWNKEEKTFNYIKSFQAIVNVNRTIFHNIGVKIINKNSKNFHQMVSFYVTGNSEELYLRGSIFFLNETVNTSENTTTGSKYLLNETLNATENTINSETTKNDSSLNFTNNSQDFKNEILYEWEHSTTFLAKSIESELRSLDYTNPYPFPQALVIYEEEQNWIIALLINEYLMMFYIDPTAEKKENKKSYLYRLEKLKKENHNVLKIELSSDSSYLYILTRKDDKKYIMVIKVKHEELPDSLEIYRIHFKEADGIDERFIKDLKIITENNIKDLKIMIAVFEDGEVGSFLLSTEIVASDFLKDYSPILVSVSFFLLFSGILFIFEGIRRCFRRGMSLRVRLMM